ncbi:maleylpyruvate isomerase family mycothiol-dependent enzyme [Streptomyces sp. PLM4]|uniref:maleylpyruvate isomerase family mycothiol-dependent enzyme n=1 Tax=Streptomyces sp. PLM4 TaxID=2929798 RepID=UPI002065CAA1|nr:maleylpyruvate isomerase family mycothiol-dependent enzyme [Streptomyces sp. PLM4]BDH67613.1 maleylpyruvate isomerase [Streptomyces sp. PLM4]
MTDPVRDLTRLDEATARLLTVAGTLDDAALAEPSRLPGWTRGHVLSHLARNADALLNVVAGRPMYASAEARDADIEAGATLPAEALAEEVRLSAARLAAALAEPGDWERVVELRNGVTDRLARVPFRRLVEVELHQVDLGAGRELEDLPAEFTDAENAFLADRFTRHPDVPPLLLRPVGSPALTSGRAAAPGEEPLTVTGTPADLLGWLAGRRAPDGLKTDGGPLPALPPL